MAALVPKGVAKTIMFPLFKNDGTLITGATGADSEVSKDHAAWADCTNEVTEIGTSGWYWITLTSTEMNADQVAYQFKSTSTGATVPALVFDTYAIPEPSAVPSWTNLTIESVLAWLLTRLKNKETTTDNTISVYKDDDTTVVATYARSDSSGTYTRGKAS